jgi:hypothetical protein
MEVDEGKREKDDECNEMERERDEQTKIHPLPFVSFLLGASLSLSLSLSLCVCVCVCLRLLHSLLSIFLSLHKKEAAHI